MFNTLNAKLFEVLDDWSVSLHSSAIILINPSLEEVVQRFQVASIRQAVDKNILKIACTMGRMYFLQMGVYLEESTTDLDMQLFVDETQVAEAVFHPQDNRKPALIKIEGLGGGQTRVHFNVDIIPKDFLAYYSDIKKMRFSPPLVSP